MRQTSVTGVLAVGMLMVIITGADRSLSWFGGWSGRRHRRDRAGLVGLWIGSVVGRGHRSRDRDRRRAGSLTAYLNIPAFIVTLGGLLAWRGVILGLSRGETIPLRLQSFQSDRTKLC